MPVLYKKFNSLILKLLLWNTLAVGGRKRVQPWLHRRAWDDAVPWRPKQLQLVEDKGVFNKIPRRDRGLCMKYEFLNKLIIILI